LTTDSENEESEGMTGRDTDRLGRIERILLIRTSALGDVVHVLPSLEALRRRFPTAAISWLVEPLGAAVLQGHPLIHRLFVIDRKQWTRDLRSPFRWPRTLRAIVAMARAVRRERFDLVIDFQGNMRSGLSTLLSGGRIRLGFSSADCRERLGALSTTMKAPPTPPLANKVLKNLCLVRTLGWEGEVPEASIVIRPEDREWARGVIEALDGSGPVVTIHPAVSRFGALKRWPTLHFKELCELLTTQLDARVLITWGPGEDDLAREIGTGMPAPPTPNILRLAALIAQSDLFVACDTGNLHLAAVLGTPLIGLYGPKNPDVYAPLGHRGRILTSGVPCSPCNLRRCEHSICMTTLLPRQVFQAARSVLDHHGSVCPRTVPGYC